MTIKPEISIRKKFSFFTSLKFEYKITILYMVIGFAWIFFSDKILLLLLSESRLITLAQTYKGIFYVSFTGFLLFSFLKRHLQKMRQAEQKVRENDRLKTAFVQNISHEIRTPMNGIIGFTNLLNSTEVSEDQRVQYLEIINKSSTQLLKIVNEVLDISLIESGTANFSESEINLNELLNEIHTALAPQMQKNVVFSLYNGLPDNESIIKTDETKLRVILLNLLNNSIKFTEKGAVNFGYVLKGKELEFFVEDSGIGIDPSLSDKIFERFYQVETSIQKLYGGVGLGLSICKGNVELMGGKIWLKSELSKGSSFFFTIPFKQGKKTDKKKTEKSETLNTHYNILILVVEDEESNYRYIKEILKNSGIKLLRAETGTKAVQICKEEEKIDLILMDLKLPEMDGYEASKRIRKILPKVPIIAQTAFALEDEKEEAFIAGCNDYITKPFKKEVLLAAIAKYCKI